MQRKILFSKESREKIKSGIDKTADAITCTLGPRGKNVIISRSSPSVNGMMYAPIHVTKDGVTVSRSILMDDYIENVGCLMLREAAEKTMAIAGDGTTTTSLLMQSIVNAGLIAIDKGANPQDLKKGIDMAVEFVKDRLAKIATPISDGIEHIRQIATVSANNDTAVGDLIADAYKVIGKEGIITIEESKSTKTEIKTVDGFKFDKGWFSHYFINEPSRGTCEFEDAYILLYQKKLYQIAPLQNILEQIIGAERPIVIICDDADGEALSFITMNTVQHRIKACIVKSPGFADKIEQMEDLGVLTGGQFISEEKGLALKEVKIGHLGSAKKVIIGRDETTIIGGRKDENVLNELLTNLRMDITKAEGEEKDRIAARIAKLTSGVAVLYVGAPTETEMKEKKDRCDDAIKATKAAIAEGFVPGGGAVFARMSRAYESEELENKDIQEGFNVVISVLGDPLKKICSNAGIDPGGIMEQIITPPVGSAIGYNAREGRVEDLIKSGIIDPVKVLRCSLEHAASAATMILTSDCLICDVM